MFRPQRPSSVDALCVHSCALLLNLFVHRRMSLYIYYADHENKELKQAMYLIAIIHSLNSNKYTHTHCIYALTTKTQNEFLHTENRRKRPASGPDIHQIDIMSKHLQFHFLTGWVGRLPR